MENDIFDAAAAAAAVDLWRLRFELRWDSLRMSSVYGDTVYT